MKKEIELKRITLHEESASRREGDIVINGPNICVGQVTISSQPGWTTWVGLVPAESELAEEAGFEMANGLTRCWYTPCVVEHLTEYSATYSTLTHWAAVYCALMELGLRKRNDADFCRWIETSGGRHYRRSNLSTIMRQQGTNLQEWKVYDPRTEQAQQSGLNLLSTVKEFRQQRLEAALGK